MPIFKWREVKLSNNPEVLKQQIIKELKIDLKNAITNRNTVKINKLKIEIDKLTNIIYPL